MATYTGTADANGDFTISFPTTYTGGQKIVVTAEKDAATESIELYAPSDASGGGFIQISGNLTNFPRNIGAITLSSAISGAINDYAFYQTSNNYSFFREATGLTINGAVTTIGVNSFAGWSKATSLTLPNSVTSIGAAAFTGWILATSMTLSNNLATIGGSAFLGWAALTSINIPASVTSIGTNAFQGLTNVTSLTIGGSPTIATEGFRGLTGLNNMY